MYKAEKIRNKESWFRTIKPGIVAKGKLPSYGSITSLNVQLTRYNRSIGKERGVFIHAKYLYDELCVILVGVTIEQRKKELADPGYKNEWRKMIKI